jgi:hypothetical protein
MDAAIASIIVACIATVGSVLVAMIQKFRIENRKDHGAVMEALKDLHGDIKEVDEKIDGHIVWHLNDKNK